MFSRRMEDLNIINGQRQLDCVAHQELLRLLRRRFPLYRFLLSCVLPPDWMVTTLSRVSKWSIQGADVDESESSESGGVRG